MKKLLLGLVALFAFAGPVVAQECENTMESATASLTANGIEFKLLPADRVQAFVDEVVEPMVGSEINNVTNVLVAVMGSAVVFGLEFDNGCLSNPVAIPGATALPVSNV